VTRLQRLGGEASEAIAVRGDAQLQSGRRLEAHEAGGGLRRARQPFGGHPDCRSSKSTMHGCSATHIPAGSWMGQGMLAATDLV